MLLRKYYLRPLQRLGQPVKDVLGRQSLFIFGGEKKPIHGQNADVSTMRLRGLTIAHSAG